MGSRDTRILQELVYQRVRSTISMCQLLAVEHDLEHCIDRALDGSPGAVDLGPAMARRYMEQAWQRLEEEWRQLRSDPGGDEPRGLVGEPCPPDDCDAEPAVPWYAADQEGQNGQEGPEQARED